MTTALGLAEKQKHRGARAFTRWFHPELRRRLTLRRSVASRHIGLDETRRASVDAQPGILTRQTERVAIGARLGKTVGVPVSEAELGKRGFAVSDCQALVHECFETGPIDIWIGEKPLAVWAAARDEARTSHGRDVDD